MSIAQVLAEGRLIRGAWSREENGRQLLCLYTAMVGDPNGRPSTCPAHLCPGWLAHMLPWLDDAGPEKHWHGMVARVARLAPRFGTLPPEAEWHVRAICVREAMRHTDDEAVLAVCEHVAALCEGGVPAPEALAKARREATGTVALQRDTLSAAQSAVWAVEEAAAAAAAMAAKAAAAACRRSAANWWGGAAATLAEQRMDEASERLIDAILDEIERALERQR